MIRNILWQVDGGLFDTRPAITYAISNAVAEMGYSMPLNVIDGLLLQSLEHCLGTLSQRFRLDPGLLRRQFTESYLKISPDHQAPFPGTVRICEFIIRHGGINIAISQLELGAVQRLLNMHGLSDYIQNVLPNESLALRKHTLNPEETLLISSYADSIKSGIYTCLFGEKMVQINADFCITHHDELQNILFEEREKR